ncbi:MAG: hypothetical protein LBK59_06160 [Bifidobacteriaceae bacterium]|jgi:hypothetical protein|nr:hypothetical protein [Bifidobacteriaceae bacterium]
MTTSHPWRLASTLGAALALTLAPIVTVPAHASAATAAPARAIDAHRSCGGHHRTGAESFVRSRRRWRGGHIPAHIGAHIASAECR